MVKRTEYLEKLKKIKDMQIIKVITGVRRCGKSTLLSQSGAIKLLTKTASSIFSTIIILP